MTAAARPAARPTRRRRRPSWSRPRRCSGSWPAGRSSGPLFDFGLGIQAIKREFRFRWRFHPAADHAGTLRVALQDPNLETYGVARFVFPWVYGFEGLAWRAWDRAVVRYGCDPAAYDAYFDGHKPEPLRLAIEGLYELIDRTTD